MQMLPHCLELNLRCIPVLPHERSPEERKEEEHVTQLLVLENWVEIALLMHHHLGITCAMRKLGK